MDMEMKRMDMEEKKADQAASLAENGIKLEIEKLKLQQAQVALRAKNVDSQMRISAEGNKAKGNEQRRADEVSAANTKRQDDIAKGVMDQMKSPPKEKTTES